VAVAAPTVILTGETWTSRERSLKEKEVLGFYFSEHPLEPLRDSLARVATHGAAEVLELEDGTEVRLAGLLGGLRTIVTRSGRRMAAVQLEDLTGRIEATVFPDLFESARALLEPETIVMVAGRVEANDRGVKLLLAEIRAFEEAREQYRPALHV